MNKNEIIEIFVNWCRSVECDSKIALEYIEGDDKKFDEIVCSYHIFQTYDAKLIRELGGENGDIAKRCLIACAALRHDNVITKPADIFLMSRLGLPLEYILKSNMHYYKDMNYRNYYDSEMTDCIIKYYGDEAESVLTAGFIKSLEIQYPVSYCLACCAAAHLIKENRYSLYGCDDVTEVVGEYAVKYDVIELLCCICGRNKNYDDKLAEILCDTNKVWRINKYIIDYRKIKKLMTSLQMEKEYRYYASINKFGQTAADEITNEIMSDEKNLITYINEIEDTKLYIYDLWMQTAVYIECFLKKGQGQESLRIFEQKYFKEIFKQMNFFNHSPSSLYESVMKSDQQAQDYFSVSGNPSSVFFGIIYSVEIFAKLSDYSEKASGLIFSVLRITGRDKKDIDSFAEIFIKFISAECPLTPEGVNDKMNKAMKAGVALDTILRAIMRISSTGKIKGNIVHDGIVLFIKAHIKETGAFCLGIIKEKYNNFGYIADILYTKCGYDDTELLLKMLLSSSKILSTFARNYLTDNDKTFYSSIKSTLDTVAAKSRPKVMEIIKKWDAIRAVPSEFTSPMQVNDYISIGYNESLEPLISFIPDSCFENVRYADHSSVVPARVIKYIFMEYLDKKQPEKISVCSKLAKMLDAADMQGCIQEIYTFWMDNGADTKYKMILVPYCIMASDTQILDLKKQLLVWAKASRGALAAFAVNAAAMNSSKCSLMMISSVAEKFPNAMVQNAAYDAFSLAAKTEGVSVEELEDRIIPTLGLNKNGELTADYGNRTFTVTMMPDFSLIIKDNSKDKIIKSMPKPAAGDDEVKAESAKKMVSELKKQLKAVTALQKTRLFNAFRSGRTWSSPAWDELFIGNPVMHIFARNLIWGEYKDGRLVSSFRLSDDCTLCDVNDDEAVLSEDAQIALVHPADMDTSDVSAWLGQLEDYEIKQPFAQMSAAVCNLSDEDIDFDMGMKKYQGRNFTVGAMTGAAKKYGMIRGELGDHGDFEEYLLEDPHNDCGIQIKFDYMYVGQEYSEEVDIDGVYFYRISDNVSTDGVLKDFTAVSPLTLSKRFVSCALAVIDEIIK